MKERLASQNHSLDGLALRRREEKCMNLQHCWKNGAFAQPLERFCSWSLAVGVLHFPTMLCHHSSENKTHLPTRHASTHVFQPLPNNTHELCVFVPCLKKAPCGTGEENAILACCVSVRSWGKATWHVFPSC